MTKPSALPRQPRKRKADAVKIKRTTTRGKPAAANIQYQPSVHSPPPRLASVVASSSGSNDYSLGLNDDDLRSTATSRFRLLAVSDTSGGLSPRKSPPRCRCLLCNSDEDRIGQNSLRSTATFPLPPANEQDPSYEEDPSEYEPAEKATTPVENTEDIKPASLWHQSKLYSITPLPPNPIPPPSYNDFLKWYEDLPPPSYDIFLKWYEDLPPPSYDDFLKWYEDRRNSNSPAAIAQAGPENGEDDWLPASRYIH